MIDNSVLKRIMDLWRVESEYISEMTGYPIDEINDYLINSKDLGSDFYRTLSKHFEISPEAFMTGKLNKKDSIRLIELEPKLDDKAVEYIGKCEKIIKDLGLIKYSNILLPKATPNISGTNVFSGGIFRSDEYEWLETYGPYPYIDLKKLLALDDFAIYEKFKDYPRNFSHVLYFLEQRGENATAVDLKKKYSASSTFKQIPPLKFDDIKSTTDLKFFETAQYDEKELGYILNQIPLTNKSYWKICKLLLNKGAYISKMINYTDRQGAIMEKDTVATMMLKSLTDYNNK